MGLQTPSPIQANCNVSSAGALVGGRGAASASRSATGTYTVTLATPVPSVNTSTVQVTAGSSGNAICTQGYFIDASTVGILTKADTGVAVDVAFCLTVIN